MTEHFLPVPSAQPDRVIALLPPIFRVQSITRLPWQDGYALNRAVLFHARASLCVEWVSRKVDARLGAGSLVSIRWLGRPASVGGAVRIARLVVLQRPESRLDLFQTIPHGWVQDRSLLSRASALWQRLPPYFRHLFNAIFWEGRRLHRYLLGTGSPDKTGGLRCTLGVAEQVIRMAAGQPLACTDVLLMAALLHEAGKADTWEGELGVRGRLVGHRYTLIEWIATATAVARVRVPEAHYVGLLHALTSARGAPNSRGRSAPATLDAVLLSSASRLSADVDPVNRRSPTRSGLGCVHPSLRGRSSGGQARA